MRPNILTVYFACVLPTMSDSPGFKRFRKEVVAGIREEVKGEEGYAEMPEGQGAKGDLKKILCDY